MMQSLLQRAACVREAFVMAIVTSAWNVVAIGFKMKTTTATAVRRTKVTWNPKSNLMFVHADVIHLRIAQIVWWQVMKMKAVADGRLRCSSAYHLTIKV